MWRSARGRLIYTVFSCGWALPKEHEETEPEFHHHPAETLPDLERGGVHLRVLAGSALGMTSPVRTFSPLFYLEAVMSTGSKVDMPTEQDDRAAYVVSGRAHIGPEVADAGRMLVFCADRPASIEAVTDHLFKKIAVAGHCVA